MSTHEKGFDGHPDDALLDRLRAGLLDAAPEMRRALEAHLKSCAACRQRSQHWSQAVRSAFGADAHDAALTQALAARRRLAMQGRNPVRVRLAPYALALAASLAALAVALGAALYLSPAPVAVPQTAEAPAPDLYADLDFYLWLATHETERSPSPGSS